MGLGVETLQTREVIENHATLLERVGFMLGSLI